MMQAFRNSAKLIAIFFGVMLVAWLLGDLSGLAGGIGQRTTVGEINGQSVDTRLFQQVVNQTIQQRQQETGRSMSLEELQSIRDEVWEQFVQNRILEQEIERHNISATTDEVEFAIRNQPLPIFYQDSSFMTGGEFDPAKYDAFLRSSAGQQFIPQLEAQYRQEIRQSKLWRLVTADVFLSDAALWQRFQDQFETVTIDLMAIIPRNAVPDSAVSVTEQEVETYYREHQDEFERSPSAFMSYVVLPRVLNASDSAAALQRARQLRNEIVEQDAPFEDIARQESADSVTGARGGELGEWTRGEFAAAFDSAAFSMPLNTVSEPVLTEFGYHLIEVTSRQGDTAEGRHILIPIELAGDHRDLLDSRADTLDMLAAERLDPAALDTAASVLGLRIRKTNPVQEGTSVLVGRQVIPDAGLWAFQAQEGEVGPIIETPDALYLFRLDSTQAGGIPRLNEIRTSVEQAARDEKKWDRAREIAAAATTRIKEGSTLPQVADALSLPHQTMGPFTRVQPPLPNPVLIGAAFGIPEGSTSDLIDTDEGLYFLSVLGHEDADSAKFASEIDQLRAEAVQRARQERIRSYLAALRQEADIEDYRSEIFTTNAQAEAAAEQNRPPNAIPGL